MSIEHLHFNRPEIYCDTMGTVEKWAAKQVVKNSGSDFIKTLREGNHKVSNPDVSKDKGRIELTVFDDGHAMRRLIKKATPGTPIHTRRTSDLMRLLPFDEQVFVNSRQMESAPGCMQVFDIYYYVPGSSPKQESIRR